MTLSIFIGVLRDFIRAKIRDKACQKRDKRGGEGRWEKLKFGKQKAEILAGEWGQANAGIRDELRYRAAKRSQKDGVRKMKSKAFGAMRENQGRIWSESDRNRYDFQFA